MVKGRGKAGSGEGMWDVGECFPAHEDGVLAPLLLQERTTKLSPGGTMQCFL